MKVYIIDILINLMITLRNVNHNSINLHKKCLKYQDKMTMLNFKGIYKIINNPADRHMLQLGGKSLILTLKDIKKPINCHPSIELHKNIMQNLQVC